MTPLQLIKNISAILFLFFSTGFAQKLTSIELTGNVEFGESYYRNWADVKSGTQIFRGIEDSIKNRIIKELANKGFYNCGISAEIFNLDSGTVSININIKEGTPTYINRIYSLESDSSDKDFIESRIQFLENKVLDKDQLESTFSELLDYYENIGNPFAFVKIESIYFFKDSTEETNLADVYLSFVKEYSSRIDKFSVLGNSKTKDYVIIRNTRINPFENYSQDKIERVPKLLNRLRFFEPVSKPVYYLNSKNEGVLEISVSEKETNSFDGIVGYVPPSAKGADGFFTGFVNINLRNLFGTERSALFNWQKENQNSQELEIKYQEPWFLNYPFNIQLGLFQRKQDTTYVQRRFNGAIEFLATEEISASLLGSVETTIPSDSETSQFSVYNSTSFITGVNLKFDSRDDVYAPTEGILFQNGYRFSSKTINGPEKFIDKNTKTKISLQSFEVDFNYFQELLARQIIAIGLHGRELQGKLFEISDLFKLGGTNSLRGYKENQFLGNRIFFSNLEYRYLLSNRSYGFLFFDSGYYLRNQDKDRAINKLEAFKLGYGLGLSLETGLGVMTVSFALGQGDSFSEGKIHFGLMNEF